MWWWLATGCREPEPPPPAAPETAHSAASPADPGLAFTGPAPTNLVVVSLDTTRRDRLGAYGGPVTTPFLDARLAEGVVWADHRSCSNWTAPSMVCAQTGRSPLELGFWPGTGDGEVPNVPPVMPTLPRVLGREGFRSALVTGNAVFSSSFAADGFDREVVLDYGGAKVVAEAALDEARGLVAGEGPFYLHVHFMDPHRPYCPPEETAPDLSVFSDVGFDVCEDLGAALAEWDAHDPAWRDALLGRVEATNAAELLWFDQQLAWLWGELDALGALDDALVVFHTDHGEQRMERGLIDHGFELHAEENRAAAGFWAKGLAPGRVTAPTLHQDVAATVFAVFGAAPEEPPTGLLVPAIPQDRARRLFAYSRVDHGAPQFGVVRGDRVALTDWAGAVEYHHTDTDPAELAPAAPDADLDALTEELEVFAGEVCAAWPHLGPPTCAR